MQLVDDRLALKALEGWRLLEWSDEVPVVTWLAHARLVRALVGGSTTGSLSREAFEGALEAALNLRQGYYGCWTRGPTPQMRPGCR